MSAFKSEIRAIVHHVWSKAIEPGSAKFRQDIEYEAIKSIMQKHRANYSIHFSRQTKPKVKK